MRHGDIPLAVITVTIFLLLSFGLFPNSNFRKEVLVFDSFENFVKNLPSKAYLGNDSYEADKLIKDNQQLSRHDPERRHHAAAVGPPPEALPPPPAADIEGRKIAKYFIFFDLPQRDRAAVDLRRSDPTFRELDPALVILSTAAACS